MFLREGHETGLPEPLAEPTAPSSSARSAIHGIVKGPPPPQRPASTATPEWPATKAQAGPADPDGHGRPRPATAVCCSPKEQLQQQEYVFPQQQPPQQAYAVPAAHYPAQQQQRTRLFRRNLSRLWLWEPRQRDLEGVVQSSESVVDRGCVASCLRSSYSWTTIVADASREGLPEMHPPQE